MFKQNIKIEKVTDDLVYFNVTLTNNQKVSVPATVVTSLPADYLDINSFWNAGVERFTIQGSSVPILVFPDNTYYVTLSYNGTSRSQPLVYSEVSDSSNNNLIPGGIFSYQQLALLINAALKLAFTALQTAVAPALAATTAPFVVFNTNNQKFQIYADSAFYDETLTTPVYLYYNSPLYYLFNNYLVQFISENNLVNLHEDYRIAIRNMGLTTNTVVSGGVTYFVMDQEYSNTSTIVEPQLINIYSNTIGIRPELTIPTNTSANNGLVNSNFASGNIPLANLIADLAPNFGNGDPAAWRSLISYIPFYRRMHNMSQLSSSKSIDLTINWENSQGVEYPFYLEPMGSMTIKFVFEKRKI
jgi:hypothetical protein